MSVPRIVATDLKGGVIKHMPVDEAWGVRRFFARDLFGRLVNILAHR